MDAQEFKTKLLENKVAVIGAVVALAAFGGGYYRQDALDQVTQEKSNADARLLILQDNERNAGRSLDDDLARMLEYHQQVESRALDFDSSIASQSFFSDLFANTTIKPEGIPSLSGQPVPAVKQYSYGAYIVQGAGSAGSLVDFAKKCEEQTAKTLRVDRLQFAAADAASVASGTSITGSIALRAWGTRGDAVKAPAAAPASAAVTGSAPAKIGMTAAQRAAKLDAAKSAFTKSIDLAGVKHLFGQAGGPASQSEGGVAAVEVALKTMKLTHTTIFGQDAIRGEKLSVKRIGNSFEVQADGATYKVTLSAVTAEGSSYTATFLVSGKMIKVPLSK